MNVSPRNTPHTSPALQVSFKAHQLNSCRVYELHSEAPGGGKKAPPCIKILLEARTGCLAACPELCIPPGTSPGYNVIQGKSYVAGLEERHSHQMQHIARSYLSSKSLSSLKFLNALIMLSWKSFHWRQSFSDLFVGKKSLISS